MMKFNKCMAMVLTMLILFSAIALQVYAAEVPNDAVAVDLSPDQKWVSSPSSALQCKQAISTGGSNESSKHNVYFIYYSRLNSSGDFVKENEKKVGKGTGFEDWKSNKHASNFYWVLQINVSGWTYKGCSAWGKMWKSE